MTYVEWTTCSESLEDGQPCIGSAVLDGLCLGHLEGDGLDTYLQSVKTGGDQGGALDGRGAVISADRLQVILYAFRDSNRRIALPPGEFGDPTFGTGTLFEGAKFGALARFDDARFGEVAGFDNARFGDRTWFGDAKFGAGASFVGATFGDEALFGNTEFGDGALFEGAKFGDRASFAGAQFGNRASFDGAIFGDGASFGEANFGDWAGFEGAKFGSGALFSDTKFGERALFNHATFGDGAWFDRANFGDGAGFEGAEFGSGAWFCRAEFGSVAGFGGAKFGDGAGFEGAEFGSWASFVGTKFGDGALFGDTTFGIAAVFFGARFGDGASFDGTKFGSGTVLDGVGFGDGASFDGDSFDDGARFGPLTSTGSFDIGGVHLPQPDEVEITAEAIDARRLRLPDGCILRINRARVDLTEVVFVQPTIISPGSASPSTEEPTTETEPDRRPSIVSLERANVANLVLTDVKLEDCRFAGAHNLDRIRLEGDITFRRARGWIKALQRNRRQVLYEEAELRGWLEDAPSGSGTPPLERRTESKDAPKPRQPLAPRRVEALYRALRKAREDGKDEPGAADFYYGEMEMRRLAAKRVSGERAILITYKALSGYGIRASRALLALAASLLLFAGAFQLWGFADPADPFGGQASETEPSQPGNQTEPVAQGSPVQPAAEDLQGMQPNGNRSALQVMADGVIYSARTSINLFGGPEVALTRWGSALQVVLRIWGPLLLGLIVLSLRGRVKR